MYSKKDGNIKVGESMLEQC